MRITSSVVSFEPRPFKPLPVTRIRFRESACACIAANLLTVYYTSGDFSSQVAMEVIASGDACGDYVFSGSNDDGVTAILDYLSPETIKWELSLDDGVETPVLYKVAGSGGPCDIASPVGIYEGGGYTMTVQDDPF